MTRATARHLAIFGESGLFVNEPTCAYRTRYGTRSGQCAEQAHTHTTLTPHTRTPQASGSVMSEFDFEFCFEIES